MQDLVAALFYFFIIFSLFRRYFFKNRDYSSVNVEIGNIGAHSPLILSFSLKGRRYLTPLTVN
jgi:hypothetical protein